MAKTVRLKRFSQKLAAVTKPEKVLFRPLQEAVSYDGAATTQKAMIVLKPSAFHKRRAPSKECAEPT